MEFYIIIRVLPYSKLGCLRIYSAPISFSLVRSSMFLVLVKYIYIYLFIYRKNRSSIETKLSLFRPCMALVVTRLDVPIQFHSLSSSQYSDLGPHPRRAVCPPPINTLPLLSSLIPSTNKATQLNSFIHKTAN